jgi:DNA end-binding protein Ku
MAARSMWNGRLHVGRISLPVKLVAAIEDRTVRFHLLHAKDGQRVAQHLVTSEEGQDVPEGEIRKGFEIEPGVFVLIEDEDLAALTPPPSRDIEITRFVPSGPESFAWYERPYYLAPDGDPAAYFALAEALAKSGREGIARWTMRKRSYAGALRAEDGYLMLISLRHAGEIVDVATLPAPGGAPLSVKELTMAEQLVAMLEEEYDPASFHDEYREKLLALIQAKSSGKVFRFERPAAKRETDDLTKALAASLSRARKERKSA